MKTAEQRRSHRELPEISSRRWMRRWPLTAGAPLGRRVDRRVPSCSRRSTAASHATIALAGEGRTARPSLWRHSDHQGSRCGRARLGLRAAAVEATPCIGSRPFLHPAVPALHSARGAIPAMGQRVGSAALASTRTRTCRELVRGPVRAYARRPVRRPGVASGSPATQEWLAARRGYCLCSISEVCSGLVRAAASPGECWSLTAVDRRVPRCSVEPNGEARRVASLGGAFIREDRESVAGTLP